MWSINRNTVGTNGLDWVLSDEKRRRRRRRGEKSESRNNLNRMNSIDLKLQFYTLNIYLLND